MGSQSVFEPVFGITIGKILNKRKTKLLKIVQLNEHGSLTLKRFNCVSPLNFLLINSISNTGMCVYAHNFSIVDNTSV